MKTDIMTLIMTLEDEMEEGDTIVLKKPNMQPSKALEEYRIDNIASDSVDLVHVEKTEVKDGEEIKVERNIAKNALEDGIEKGRVALLKDPLEVLYYH